MNLSGIAWLATISFVLNINKIIQLCVKIIYKKHTQITLMLAIMEENSVPSAAFQ